MRKKVLLINPSYQPHWSKCEPTGLLYIASFLKKNDIKVRILDLNVEKKNIEGILLYIKKYKPNFIGISSITRQAMRAYNLGRRIKRRFPHTTLIYGGVLAVADALNYCDGHMENLIASAGYPVLIDHETFFHVFGATDPELGERSILFTGLIEKPPQNESDKGFTAAFQALSVNRYELLFPYAINDHTDEIEVRYRGFSNMETYNSPVFDNVIQTPLNFIEDFIEGFEFGYNQITDKTEEWTSNKGWWTILKSVKVRQLIRHTLYYELIIRKMQQPEGCINKVSAYQIVYNLLFSENQDLKKVMDYELRDILKLDIPFFYHFPDSLDLYDGNGICYPKYFNSTALEEMREQAKNRSQKYLRRNIEILRNILPASPEPVQL